MENIEQKRPPRNDHIEGSHADICLVKATEWKRFLKEPGAHNNINLDKKNELPAPIDSARLDYWAAAEGSEDEGMFELNAEIDFRPEMARDGNQPWQLVIMNRLESTLDANGIKPHILTHEIGSLYARIAPNHLAHVTTSTEPDRCIVGVRLVNIDVLENSLDVNDDIAHALPDTPYHILKGCLTVWSHAIDAVADSYGIVQNDKSRPKRRISLRVNKPVITPPIEESFESAYTYPQKEHLNENGLMFSDIAGYSNIKNRLRELIIQQKYPDIAHNMELDRTQGILLYGAPGTAKTMLLKAFANEIDAELVTITVSEIVEKWVGSSARNLDTYFSDLVQKKHKIVVLMDEFDSIAVAADEASSSERVDTTNRLKEWVTQITENHHNIILTAATNNPDLLDPAVVRPGRFLRIEVPAPDEEARKEIWSLMIGKLAIRAVESLKQNPHAEVLRIDHDNINIPELAKETEGMVGAHFSAILDAIKRQRLREYDVTGKIRPLDQTDIINEIEIIKEQD